MGEPTESIEIFSMIVPASAGIPVRIPGVSAFAETEIGAISRTDRFLCENSYLIGGRVRSEIHADEGVRICLHLRNTAAVGRAIHWIAKLDVGTDESARFEDRANAFAS